MRKRSLLSVLMIPAIALCLNGCHRGASSSEDETPVISASSPAPTPANQFERDLKYVRDGHFAHMWIFSRKDGKELAKEDSDVLRTNAPKVVDWVTTDEKRKVIAGSNFDLEPAQLATLQKRFKVEDYTGK